MIRQCAHEGRRAGAVRRCLLPEGHGSPLHVYGQLAEVSEERAALNRVRTKVLRPLREAQTWCARCGAAGVGLDGHELVRRSQGGSITDLANIVLVCRSCHTWIGANPSAAKAEGWAA